ncbi:unnamed protein product, partial [Prorocentrum cordatum]
GSDILLHEQELATTNTTGNAPMDKCTPVKYKRSAGGMKSSGSKDKAAPQPAAPSGECSKVLGESTRLD